VAVVACREAPRRLCRAAWRLWLAAWRFAPWLPRLPAWPWAASPSLAPSPGSAGCLPGSAGSLGCLGSAALVRLAELAGVAGSLLGWLAGCLGWLCWPGSLPACLGWLPGPGLPLPRWLAPLARLAACLARLPRSAASLGSLRWATCLAYLSPSVFKREITHMFFQYLNMIF
jgi:hypothetical protein